MCVFLSGCDKPEIRSMQQLPGVDSFVVITDTVKASAIKRVVEDLATKRWAKGTPFWMPVVPEKR
jgi:hypothetical protein